MPRCRAEAEAGGGGRAEAQKPELQLHSTRPKSGGAYWPGRCPITGGSRRSRKGVRSSRRRKPRTGCSGTCRRIRAAACGVIGLVGPAGRAGARTRAAPGNIGREWYVVTGASVARGVLTRVAAGVGPASSLTRTCRRARAGRRGGDEVGVAAARLGRASVDLHQQEERRGD
eukprot:scaffold80517_cov60-Phaeocystis_antarctica.AAC.3